MIKASNNPFECTPVIISPGGDSFTQYREDFTYVNGDPQTFELPEGIIPSAVFHNRSLLLETEYTVTGTTIKTVTITAAFDEDETNIITITN